MGITSDDDFDQMSEERCFGSYSLSADVSESESSSSFSHLPFDAEGGASSSIASSPNRRPPDAMSFGRQVPVMSPVIGGRDVVLWEDKKEKNTDSGLSEVEMMKERFAKLLLGEDMSGGGKGVCTALSISNAITNLSATVFGELWRLEPLAEQKKLMWRREMEWLLCVSDSIVELVPSIQQFPGGGTYEVMETRPRSDLYVNLPALKKLDAMLLSMLDGFSKTEFSYLNRIIDDTDGCEKNSSGFSVGRPSIRQEEKWWLPCPKVPQNGLSDDARKRLKKCRDCTNQILKAAMTINGNVLAEMDIPNAYLDTLPKNGKDCLGHIIYSYITADNFSPECLLDCLDLSSEHHALDLTNRVEAAVYIWKLKNQRKHSGHVKAKRTSWGRKVKGLVNDTERNNLHAKRAETLLHSLRLRFPGLPQTALDINKIQYNKDVGQSILESYSRVTESLAFNIIARIDDVIYVDECTKRCTAVDSTSIISRGGGGGAQDGIPIQKRMSLSPFSIKETPSHSPFATPSFTPVGGSPGSASSGNRKNSFEAPERKAATAADFEKRSQGDGQGVSNHVDGAYMLKAWGRS
ncbi:hypothetical protein SAY87_022970 [Trapa incisa]|uniref:PRONE domain-containing protein n=1 Tax=Trapa incisa TaxID=236973 RepID=A0AAN7K7E9_9MYRT|nr:hypothetical protein SAY87_022970 [Trapa incisa]